MRALIISAHPDDETLGCGGTLLKHRAAGDDIFWVIASQTHQPQWSGEVIERKKIEIESVAKAYGFKEHVVLGYPAAQLDTVSKRDMVQTMAEAVSNIKPEAVYLVHGGDVHSDHNVVFTASMAALKPAYMPRMNVRRIA